MLDDILQTGKRLNATNLTLGSGKTPAYRVNKKIIRSKNDKTLSSENIKEIFNKVKTPIYVDSKGDKYFIKLSKIEDCLSVHIKYLKEPKPLSELGLPEISKEFSSYKDGIILITGPANSGKSWTANAIIDSISDERDILVGNFKPNVRLESEFIFSDVDEILDLDFDIYFLESKLEYLFELATSGKLVIATLPTYPTSLVLHHLIRDDSYKAHVLSTHLRALIDQRLIPGIDGEPKLAFELLLPTPEIRKFIKENNLDPVSEIINKGESPIISLNQSILNLIIKRKIELKYAFSISSDPENLDRLLKKAGV